MRLLLFTIIKYQLVYYTTNNLILIPDYSENLLAHDILIPNKCVKLYQNPPVDVGTRRMTKMLRMFSPTLNAQ